MYGLTVGPKDEIYTVGWTASHATAMVALGSNGTPLAAFGSGGWLAYGLFGNDSPARVNLEWVGGIVPYRGRLVTMISANTSVPFSVVRIWN